MAAKGGKTDTVRLLLEKGADPNIKCQYGYTALYRAVENNKYGIVELLLKNGADPDIEDLERQYCFTLGSMERS